MISIDGMSTFLVTLMFFAAVITVMSVGVMFRRKPLEGSCGGLGALGLGDCDFCEGDPEKCDRRTSQLKEIA
tara:strand:+ start:151 stop:366 length:216 start_codon:yes stop_codon:yes gene_type:complete